MIIKIECGQCKGMGCIITNYDTMNNYICRTCRGMGEISINDEFPWVWNDGGRKEAGYKGYTGDCVVRSIAIAAELPYKKVYDEINHIGKSEAIGKNRKRFTGMRSNSHTGVFMKTMKSYLKSIGWKWTPTMKIGSGCKVHLRKDELPMGRVIARVTKHVVAVVDGVVHDIEDCTREGTRCVYGYWSRGE